MLKDPTPSQTKSSTPHTQKSSKTPTWTGIVYFLVDVGLSSCLGFIIGVVAIIAIYSSQNGAGGIDHLMENISNSMFLVASGTLISAYAGYLLYKRLPDPLALFALVTAGLIGGIMYIYTGFLEGQLTVSALAIAGTIIAYFVGWLVAKDTTIRIFIPRRGWIKAFAIIGGIVFIFSFLATLLLFYNHHLSLNHAYESKKISSAPPPRDASPRNRRDDLFF